MTCSHGGPCRRVAVLCPCLQTPSEQCADVCWPTFVHHFHASLRYSQCLVLHLIPVLQTPLRGSPVCFFGILQLFLCATAPHRPPCSHDARHPSPDTSASGTLCCIIEPFATSIPTCTGFLLPPALPPAQSTPPWTTVRASGPFKGLPSLPAANSSGPFPCPSCWNALRYLKDTVNQLCLFKALPRGSVTLPIPGPL